MQSVVVRLNSLELRFLTMEWLMPSKKPNILFIMADQMRHDALGCNGNRIIQTPELDSLASSGVSFRNSYSPDPICVPARASITTGFYPHKCTGVKSNGGRIRDGFPLLGRELTERGYRTYAMGKLHYLPYAPPGKERTTYGIETVELAESGRILRLYDIEGRMKGLEDYHDYLYSAGWGGYERGHGLGNNDVFPAPSPIPRQYYVDAWVADRALYHMGEHLEKEPDKPFFMWASFPKPHSAYDPPRPYDAMYDPRDMPPPAGTIRMLEERGLYHLARREKQYMWQFLSPGAKNVIKAHYYGLVSHQDSQAGRLLGFLREKGIEENTVVIYSADHGDMLGDFGLYFKSCFYSGSVKVPLIIRYPGVFDGGLMPGPPAGLQDIMPTLIELAGEPLAVGVDGENLADVTAGAASREYYVSQCGDEPRQQYMAADENWKYIYHQQGGAEELYNLAEDPSELNNLAGTDSAEAASAEKNMREYLVEWCRENDDAMMLEDGMLAREENEKPPEEAQIHSPYGRRLY